jgi:hypothetical protein
VHQVGEEVRSQLVCKYAPVAPTSHPRKGNLDTFWGDTTSACPEEVHWPHVLRSAASCFPHFDFLLLEPTALPLHQDHCTSVVFPHCQTTLHSPIWLFKPPSIHCRDDPVTSPTTHHFPPAILDAMLPYESKDFQPHGRGCVKLASVELPTPLPTFHGTIVSWTSHSKTGLKRRRCER